MKRAILLFAFLVAALGTACYDRPTCSFRCGENQACPHEYECASDGWCKLKGTDDGYECSGNVPTDASPPDAAPEPDSN